ncbi:MAG: hypothetical protein LLG13_17135 [Bacteroidales bacterium]|nr:hypothetical protein [Bacteroidales bacterium]
MRLFLPPPCSILTLIIFVGSTFSGNTKAESIDHFIDNGFPEFIRYI